MLPCRTRADDAPTVVARPDLRSDHACDWPGQHRVRKYPPDCASARSALVGVGAVPKDRYARRRSPAQRVSKRRHAATGAFASYRAAGARAAICLAMCSASLPAPWIIAEDIAYRKCRPTRYSPG